LKFAHEQGCPWLNDTCSAAALGGHLAGLVYAHEQGCTWDNVTCLNASANGHLQCLKYARLKDCPWDVETAIAAAKGNHSDCLLYARENHCEWNESLIAVGAAQKGHLADLAGLSLTPIYTAAARNGHLHCLEYLHLRYQHVNIFQHRRLEVVNAAAKGNHWDYVLFLHTIGYEWSYTTASETALNCHVEVLQKLHENGCSWDQETPFLAAKYGHIKCLKYACDHDCPYSASACDEAERNGHTACAVVHGQAICLEKVIVTGDEGKHVVCEWVYTSQ